MSADIASFATAVATIFGVGIDLATLFAPKSVATPNIVKVIVGLQRAADKNAKTGIGADTGGGAPGITIWDAAGGLISSIEGKGSIGDGSEKDYGFHTGADQRAAEYVSISASSSNGICISSVAVTTPGDNNYAWFGDTARVCGLPWYYSESRLGTTAPACAWIDGNGADDHKYKGMSIHMPSFMNNLRQPEDTQARVTQQLQHTHLMCQSKARFSMWTEIVPQNDIFVFGTALDMSGGPDTVEDQNKVLNSSAWLLSDVGIIEGVTGNGLTLSSDATPCFHNRTNCHAQGPSADERFLTELDPSKRRRDNHRRQSIVARIMPDHLIVTPHDSHSARDLCQDLASEGPDLVSLAEGLFCDMSTLDNRKQLYPLCSESTTSNCFDMDTYTIRGSNSAGASPPYPMNGTLSNSTFAKIASGGSSVPSKNYTNVQTWS